MNAAWLTARETVNALPSLRKYVILFKASLFAILGAVDSRHSAPVHPGKRVVNSRWSTTESVQALLTENKDIRDGAEREQGTLR